MSSSVNIVKYYAFRLSIQKPKLSLEVFFRVSIRRRTNLIVFQILIFIEIHSCTQLMNCK